MSPRVSLVIALVMVPSLASAHIDLLFPLDRYNNGAQKDPPCGPPSEPTNNGQVYMFQPGATISVLVDETIRHPGFFRVSLDDEGTDDFVNPADPTDFFNNSTVLADNVLPNRNLGGEHCFQVTLPNIECTDCTLQVQQIMLDKPPYSPNGNDIYYRCANIILSSTAPAVEPDPTCSNVTPPPPPPGSGGCVIAKRSAAGAGLFFLLFAGLLAACRRRS